MKIYQNFINGAFVATPDSRRMPTSNPFSGEVWAEVADDPAAVDVAVRAARSAFEDGPWATMPGRERAHLMTELGRIITRDADELGVVGDDEEIQGPDQLYRLTAIGDDLLSPSEAKSLVNTQSGPHQPGIERQVGVEVGITKQDLIRIIPAGEGRVDSLFRESFGGNNTIVRRGKYRSVAQRRQGDN